MTSCFCDADSSPCLYEQFKLFTNMFPRRGQKALKNSIVSPLFPGILSFWKSDSIFKHAAVDSSPSQRSRMAELYFGIFFVSKKAHDESLTSPWTIEFRIIRMKHVRDYFRISCSNTILELKFWNCAFVVIVIF